MDRGLYYSMSNIMIVLNDTQYSKTGGYLQEYFLAISL